MAEEAVQTPPTQSNEGEETNLFGGVETNQEAAQPQSGEGPGPEGNDPNVQPQVDPNERPPGLPEKFSSVEELAQAYNEMGKKIREKFELPEGFDSPSELVQKYQELAEKSQPPEEYEVQPPEGLDDFELTDLDKEKFKEMGLNNEQAQQLVNYFSEAIVPELQKAQSQVETERLARQWNMNPDSQEYKERLAAIKEWAHKTYPEAVVNDMAKTHNGVNALYQMMRAGFEKNVAQGQDQQGPSVTMEQIQSRVNDDRYWSDPAFRSETERLIQQAAKR